jgi:diguanylate cyclase (GGDEF)-like protein/PAS domain S-box-containing protein
MLLFPRMDQHTTIQNSDTEEAVQGDREIISGIYEDVFEHAPDGLIIFNNIGTIINANPSAVKLYKYPIEVFLKLSAADIIFGKSMIMFEQFKAELRAKGDYYNETVDHDRNGRIFSAEIRGTRIESGSAEMFIAVVRDITDRKRMMEKLEYMAHYDILTGLPNRVFFYNKLAHAIAFAKREKSQLALLFLDIDGFKEVNDIYGHNIGDMVLQSIADRLRQCVRESDIVARIGGDEMTVILSKIAHRDDAAIVARKIIEACTPEFRIESISCSIGVSIGISIYPDDGKETESLLKKADIAMYQVKESGKNSFRFFQ